MKIAGRKNSGAWYRTNRYIRSLTDDERGKLSDLLGAHAGMSAETPQSIMFNVMQAVNDGVVPSSGGDPYTADLVLGGWVDIGIPFDVFMGQLSYDRYEKVGPGLAPTQLTSYPGAGVPETNTTGKFKYVPINQGAIAWVGKVVRKRMAQYMFAGQKVRDLINRDYAHNPGGLADAHKDK